MALNIISTTTTLEKIPQQSRNLITFENIGRYVYRSIVVLMVKILVLLLVMLLTRVVAMETIARRYNTIYIYLTVYIRIRGLGGATRELLRSY